ncbi:S26 family signal peptidase [Halomicrococcus sp. SG-WS-1]|uniref:S26 family signal peptidase n=1 Tax=Halomicrococcus sp. SG-WS-1 TaxID=3439057 RepID=UPI003F79955E
MPRLRRVAPVAVVLVVLATAGVRPPTYAVVSGSMAPNVEVGDAVVVVDEEYTRPRGSRDGVVTVRAGRGTGYRSLGGYGDVILFAPDGRADGLPVVHRARFWVEEGENWYDEARPAFVAADDCRELRNCPAPHAGFVTKGDANGHYDQATGLSEPVRPRWVRGVVVARVPEAGRPVVWYRRYSRTSATFTSDSPPVTVASWVSE